MVQRSPRWAVWNRLRLVTKEGIVYLDRLRLLQTPYFGIYLHWINGPDPDPDPHDHPWNFWSFILWGGYTEVYYNTQHNLFSHNLRHWARWSWHRMSARGVAHRIWKVHPHTMTLIIVGRRQRDWGFWTDGGAMRLGGKRMTKWVSWEEYEKRSGSKQVKLS